MVSVGLYQLVMAACLSSVLQASNGETNYLLIAPQSPLVEIGTNFTATCILNTKEVTSDDLFWTWSGTTIPTEQYTKINGSVLNVTIPIVDEVPGWLFCKCKKENTFCFLNSGKIVHGIMLKKGYPPRKPENLSCIALQEGWSISTKFSCKWEPGRQNKDVVTSYTLTVAVILGRNYTAVTTEDNVQVTFEDSFPNHMSLEVWVEAHNRLGRIQSEHLHRDANGFVKTDPPSNIKVISENIFATSLVINWTQPLRKEYVKLSYEIRYCPEGSESWTYVPLVDTAMDIQSFRLQNLRPDTVYVTQVRCKNAKEGQGYWSNWSTNATKRTPEYKPTSKPDVWRSIAEADGVNEVQFICKDPVFSNGRITRFNISIQDPKDKVKNRSSDWESIPVNMSDSNSSQQKITLLKQIHLADKKSVRVTVKAVNSMGESPEASLVISEKSQEPAPVKLLNVWPSGGQLWVEWTPPNSPLSEYVVEWVSGGQIDWQRVNRTTRRIPIAGNLKKFVCYNVSVYPIYSGWIGKPARMEAFLEQGAPLKAPEIKCTAGHNEAELKWDPIPQDLRQGFITNYTIFYQSGEEKHNITVSADTTSYTLKPLSDNTNYITWIKASTIGGSAISLNHSFITRKYAPGEVESIVVGVCLGFLFIFVMTMLVCVYKKDVIKENFWPEIPNPGESTIGSWSPDYPLKAETPKQNCLSGISVLDVDVCDGKCVFEEDKASLSLKKDKYLSEEHSSGIGGSSCMSSPRQSVSDSDEGGDMADTTASTVQYSSVVASNGYKGQTPNSQPQQAIFSRSESTQPLLDSEENPDMLVQEGSRQSQCFPRQPCFTRAAGNQDSSSQLETEQQEVLEPLDLCPLEDDFEQTTPSDGQSAVPLSSYMPQLGGYRPQ
ncbi:interleukin-6 receptor subunit beta [Centropristis striata]|uniref:interleukin-6 receptor subunit beta n=1 Tax=Centropristis striata TaxID=184440 RepID=UPI0027E20F45|nr:interleukin-6 receptor subunit beta [Centropristis striata]